MSTPICSKPCIIMCRIQVNERMHKSWTEMGLKIIIWIDVGIDEERSKLHYCMSFFERERVCNIFISNRPTHTYAYVLNWELIFFSFIHWFDTATASMAYFPILDDRNLIYMQNELIGKWKLCCWWCCRCCWLSYCTTQLQLHWRDKTQFIFAQQQNKTKQKTLKYTVCSAMEVRKY